MPTTRMAAAAMIARISGTSWPLPDLAFWPENPMSGTRKRHVHRHNPCHTRDRAAAISAGSVRSGAVAICLGIPGADREYRRCRGAVAQPALEDHRWAWTPAGGQGAGGGRQDAAAETG